MLKNSRHSGLPGEVLRVVLIDEPSTSGDVLVGALRQSGREVLVERADHEAVSYTHLTLPTIYSV